MGGGIPRQRAAQPQQADRNQLLALLPILLVFLFPLISSIISGIFSTPPTPDPAYAFSQSKLYNSERITTPHNVPYYVNKQQFSKHPIWESIPTEVRNLPQAGNVARANISPLLRSFEKSVEERFATFYWDLCQRDEQRKRNEVANEQGIFGIGTDWDKIKRIQERKSENCRLLRQYGFIE